MRVPGIGASRLHEDLCICVRHGARARLQSTGLGPADFYMTPGDNGAASFVSDDGRVSLTYDGRRADVWVVSRHIVGSCCIAVEVGNFEREKWRGICPAIHISKMGGVILLDAGGGNFEQLVLDAVRDAVDEYVRTGGCEDFCRWLYEVWQPRRPCSA